MSKRFAFAIIGPMRWPIFLLLGLVACQVAAPEASRVVTTTAVLPPSSATPDVGIAFATRLRPTVPILQAPTQTPLPPPTATPSPTPIVYEIQAGDTLLEIALQRGVTVAEIEALNPNVQPERLQVGQQIVLPQLTTAVLLTNRATPIPPSLTIAQLHMQQMPNGGAWVIGELTNDGAAAAEGVAVLVSLLGPTGDVAASQTVWSPASIVPPQTSVPFGVLFPSAPEDAQPSVQIAAGQTVVDVGSRYNELVVVEDTVTIAAGLLVGEVENVGAETVKEIRLIATGYGENGRLVNFRQRTLPDELLAAGKRTTFQMNIDAANVVSYAFIVEGLRVGE